MTEEIVEKVHLDAPLRRVDGLILLIEEKVKQKGEIWYIHKNDSDEFPSNPHAHNYQTGEKLHLGNGDLFFGREPTGRVRPKDLKKLRSKIHYRPLPPLDFA